MAMSKPVFTTLVMMAVFTVSANDSVSFLISFIDFLNLSVFPVTSTSAVAILPLLAIFCSLCYYVDMDTNTLATMISLGCFDKNQSTDIRCEITLTPEQAQMIKKALQQGKKVRLVIED